MDSNIAGDNLNENNLLKIIKEFEKRLLENQNLRIKYDSDPTKFAASETELFASLDQIQAISTQPELYRVLISKKTLTSLNSLIHHANTDISSKVITILQEFTDIDDDQSQEDTEALIKSLLKDDIILSITMNLRRLDENNKEDAQTITNSLAIIENILDFDLKNVDSAEKIIEWMMSKLKIDYQRFQPVKLSMIELLSVLLMSNNNAKDQLREFNGIDILLRQVAHYRGYPPDTGDEHEFLEQVVNCLCTAVLDSDDNKKTLTAESGVELITLILKEKRDAVKQSNIKLSMLKLLNHLLTSDKNEDKNVTACCFEFIENLGLKVLFPFFLNPRHALNIKVKRREIPQVLDEVEEHTSAIILALLKYSKNTDHIQRILIKFAESNYEKLERLIGLHDKYFKLVKKIEHDKENGDNEDDEGDINDRSKSSAYFTLRSVDYILLLIAFLGNQFETYDPTSGETLTNFITNKLLARRPELRHQIVFEVQKHIDEVESTSIEESNSLELLLKNFEHLATSNKRTLEFD